MQEYRNAEFVQQTFDALKAAFAAPGSGDPVLDFFEKLGLAWRQEADGRRYPLANKASVVLDVLRAECMRLGIEEVCNAPVVRVEPPRVAGKPFTLQLADGTFCRAGAVIVACGGQALSRLDVASLALAVPTPVLGPLQVAEEDQALTRALANIRVRCNVSLFRDGASPDELIHVHTETGELLFRDYGVSGICIFNLSRFAQPGDALVINFLQTDSEDMAFGYVQERAKNLLAQYRPLTYERFLRGVVVPRVAEELLKREGIDAHAEVDSVSDLVSMLAHTTLMVEAPGPTQQCQVHRGGFAPEGFDAATLQVLGTPGLFAAGEALDVDGPCGGYNLHWAWASGLLAGHSASQYLGMAAHA